MIRHFLGLIFCSFIAQVIFINLFQYSGALMPFQSDFGPSHFDTQNTYFGFSSLILFIQTVSSDNGITTGISAITTGINIIQRFSVNSIVSLFDSIYNAGSLDIGSSFAFIFSNLLRVVFDFIVGPIMWAVGLMIIIFGLLLFLWQLFSFIIFFIIGKFNMDFPDSGLLESTISNLPNLLWCLSAPVRSC